MAADVRRNRGGKEGTVRFNSCEFSLPAINHEMNHVPQLSPAELASISAIADHVDSTLSASFALRLNAWRQDVNQQPISLQADTQAYTSVASYQALIGLGHNAAPLLLRHMVNDSDGFFLLLALRAVSGKANLGAAVAACDEQSKARCAAREWLAMIAPEKTE